MQPAGKYRDFYQWTIAPFNGYRCQCTSFRRGIKCSVPFLGSCFEEYVTKLDIHRCVIVDQITNLSLDNGGFYMSGETELTPEKIEQFLANPGTRQQLS